MTTTEFAKLIFDNRHALSRHDKYVGNNTLLRATSSIDTTVSVQKCFSDPLNILIAHIDEYAEKHMIHNFSLTIRHVDIDVDNDSFIVSVNFMMYNVSTAIDDVAMILSNTQTNMQEILQVAYNLSEQLQAALSEGTNISNNTRAISNVYIKRFKDMQSLLMN